MKQIVTFIIVMIPLFLSAQGCYKPTRQAGIDAYNAGNKKKAKECFNAAKLCPDKPTNNDLEDWISKCLSHNSPQITIPRFVFDCPDTNHPHAIDLGLPSGTKWACCNIGSTKPEGYGGYYAWGEVETKKVYKQDEGYLLYDKDNKNYTYLGDDISGTQYDVAFVKWGEPWKMPTFIMFKELVDNCESKWVSCNGVIGKEFVGRNGRRLFFPAGGEIYNKANDYKSYAGHYFSSSWNRPFESQAKILAISDSYSYYESASSRYCGLSVRAIIEKTNCPDSNHPHAIDLGLPSRTLWSCCNIDASAPEEAGGYYAWGEKETKTHYTWETYGYTNGDGTTVYEIGEDIGATKYDVALFKWGGKWQMANALSFEELIYNCSTKWVIFHGKYGCELVGPNGNKIFFPAVGYRMNNAKEDDGKIGSYATSSLYTEFKENSFSFDFDPEENDSIPEIGYCKRFYGQPVRPIIIRKN